MKAARLSGVAVALSGAALDEVPFNTVIDQGVTCWWWREISVRYADGPDGDARYEGLFCARFA